MILSDRDDHPLDAAQAAYVFGCDVEPLAAEYREHLEQSEVWSGAALDARNDGDLNEAEACQHEARAWAAQANTLRDAAALCEARGLASSDWPIAEHVRRYREASAERWHVFHVVRERLGLAEEDPECCESTCCANDCCGGEGCDCDGCTAGWTECTVCGEVRVVRALSPEVDLSAVDENPEVVAAKLREDRALDELFAAFDSAAGEWRAAVGLA